MLAQTVIHVAAGTIALVAGAGALIYAKGGPRHAFAGSIFLPAMVVMAVTGGMVAVFKPAQPTTAWIAALTCYLLVSSWATARRRNAAMSAIELAAVPVTVGCAAAFVHFGVLAARQPTGMFDGYDSAMFFVFGGVAALAAMLDLNAYFRGIPSGVQRISRHLWRMCTALFIAAGSFFLGQQDEFPEVIQGSPVLVALAILPLAAMAYWLARVRFTRKFSRGRALLGDILHGSRAPQRS